jgi:hypothetical protein
MLRGWLAICRHRRRLRASAGAGDFIDRGNSSGFALP